MAKRKLQMTPGIILQKFCFQQGKYKAQYFLCFYVLHLAFERLFCGKFHSGFVGKCCNLYKLSFIAKFLVALQFP